MMTLKRGRLGQRGIGVETEYLWNCNYADKKRQELFCKTELGLPLQFLILFKSDLATNCSTLRRMGRLCFDVLQVADILCYQGQN